MKASVVISSYSIERASDILDATDSVLRQTYPEKEIVLVVDRGKPELYHFLQESFPGTVSGIVSVIESKQPQGLSAARNAGIEASTGEIVVFLDDDAIAEEGWLENLMDNYRDSQVMAAGGKAIPLWKGRQPAWLPEELYWIVGCTYRGYANGTRTRVRNIHGNTMSFRREIFNTVGSFDDNVGHRGGKPLGGEETDFCMRITSSYPEAKIIYDPRVIISHKVPARRCTLRYLFQRSYGEGVGKAIINHQNRLVKAPIKVEMGYLRYLLTDFLPRGVRRLLSKDFCRVLAQMYVVGLTIFATGLGYSVTRIRMMTHYDDPEKVTR